MADTEPQDPLAALRGKSWEELETIEHEDRVLFPDKLRKRGSKSLVEVPVYVRVLRKPERRKARMDAEAWAAKEGLDVEKNPQLFEDMDTVCILARAIREATAPHEQHRTPERLELEYDSKSLVEMWDKLQVYESLLDPRINIVDDKTFWAAVGGIVRTRSILPLTELESLAQSASILRMAEAALTSPTFKSFCSQFESSTQGS